MNNVYGGGGWGATTATTPNVAKLGEITGKTRVLLGGPLMKTSKFFYYHTLDLLPSHYTH